MDIHGRITKITDEVEFEIYAGLMNVVVPANGKPFLKCESRYKKGYCSFYCLSQMTRTPTTAEILSGEFWLGFHFSDSDRLMIKFEKSANLANYKLCDFSRRFTEAVESVAEMASRPPLPTVTNSVPTAAAAARPTATSNGQTATIVSSAPTTGSNRQLTAAAYGLIGTGNVPTAAAVFASAPTTAAAQAVPLDEAEAAPRTHSKQTHRSYVDLKKKKAAWTAEERRINNKEKKRKYKDRKKMARQSKEEKVPGDNCNTAVPKTILDFCENSV